MQAEEECHNSVPLWTELQDPWGGEYENQTALGFPLTVMCVLRRVGGCFCGLRILYHMLQRIDFDVDTLDV